MIVGAVLRNRYRLIRQLGSGGFGVTYLADDEDLPGKPQCVVKHFKPKYSSQSTLPIAKDLFDREANILYKLGQEHDQIPKLFAHFEEDGEFYLVQEYVHGHNLATEFRHRCLMEQEVFHLLFSILGVLSVVHQHGVIHRDIKPPNLMRRYRDGKIVLIDFGAVKEVSTLAVNAQGQTSSITVVIGSTGYMPDEQANGKPKLSSDVYAVGAIGIQALTGIPPSKLPEDPETGAIIWRDRTKASDILANILDTMVKPHFSQRYRSAVEAMQALLTAAAMLPYRLDKRVNIPVNVLNKVDPPLPILPSETGSTSDISIDNLSTSADLTTDSENSGEPTVLDTSETVVRSDIPTSISTNISSSSSELIDTSTEITKNGQDLSLPGSTRQMLKIGGLGAIVTISVSLIFLRVSIPDRMEIKAPRSSAPVEVPRAVVSLPNPKSGKIALARGLVYEGEILKNRPNGKGKVTAATYYCVGDFRNGELNGKGFCNYKDGGRYEGEFRNDKFNGKGIIKYAGGDRYEGEFRDDNLNGKGVMIYKDGRRDEGIWKDGNLVK